MTSPQGKLVPAKIRQWDNFEDSQKQIWDTMGAADSDFFLERHFEPIIFLEIFGKRIRTCSISSEQDLTHATWDVIEYPVASIISKASENPSIAKALLLKGSVMFPNRGNGLDDNADEVVERLKILEMATPIRNPRPDGSTGSAGSQSNGYTRANQICVYKLENKRQVPAFIITYKSPHRLTLDMISIGLRDMDNYNDIVNTVIVEEDPVTAHAKLEVAAAITETFDYIVESRLQYAYVCTGLASIFLHIKTDDPTTVYYHLSIPREELREGTGQQAGSSDPNLLHATAIGRVAIFDIQALQEKQLTNQWLDEAKTKLQRWEKDYVTMLRDIPETIRKDARSTPYKVSHPIKQSDVNSSPIWLRSKAAATKSAQRDPDADDLSPRGKSDKDSDNAVSNDNDSQDTCSDGSPCPPATSEPPSKRGTQIGGQRSYCTQQCLLGLLHGSQLDEQCPNVDEHRKSDGCRHDITQYKFLRRLQKQLAQNLDDDVEPWYITGSRGMMFKITLSSHGYTVAAKATTFPFIDDLIHEGAVYHHLHDLQGTHIPVCLGNIDLEKPYHYTARCILMHMMFLAYVDEPLIAQKFTGDMSDLSKHAIDAINALHSYGVAHRDVALRNMFWNEQANCVLFIDFERSVVFGTDEPEKEREPLAAIFPNASSKQKQERGQIPEDDQVPAEDITYKVILRNRFDKSPLYSCPSTFKREFHDTKDEIARLAVGWGAGRKV